MTTAPHLTRNPDSDSDPAVLWHTDGPVATITLHRPACRNAVDGATARLLREAFERFERFEADDTLAVAVFTGGGHFCADADLAAVADPAPAPPRGRRNTWGGPAFVSHEHDALTSCGSTLDPRGVSMAEFFERYGAEAQCAVRTGAGAGAASAALVARLLMPALRV